MPNKNKQIVFFILFQFSNPRNQSMARKKRTKIKVLDARGVGDIRVFVSVMRISTQDYVMQTKGNGKVRELDDTPEQVTLIFLLFYCRTIVYTYFQYDVPRYASKHKHIRLYACRGRVGVGRQDAWILMVWVDRIKSGIRSRGQFTLLVANSVCACIAYVCTFRSIRLYTQLCRCTMYVRAKLAR